MKDEQEGVHPSSLTIHPSRIAWLSLDESDNDPAGFTAYLIAALQQVQDGIGETTLAMLRAPQSPPPEAALTVLINELAAIPFSFVLVLDDYHAIHTPTIHERLAFLLEHQPPQMHMVLNTREDPLLPIARLRATGQVVEIRQDDLRFSSDECADFLQRVMGIPVTENDVATLERRTEGWIAGLQLAALSMQGHEDLQGFIQAFTGSSRFVLDYLMEEVFERQSADVKDFLLRTSILERLSAPLCDAVVEIGDWRLETTADAQSPISSLQSQTILEHLESSNLFIVPLDQSRQWYRYHRLFAELLRHRLRAVDHPLEAALHQRASQWFEAKELVSEAIQHALAAQDWGRAAALIGQTSDAMLKRGEVVRLVRWFRNIPEDVLLSDPRLCSDYCWTLLLTGQFEAAAPLLDRVEQAAKDDPVYLGEVAAAQAYLARAQGDHARMVELSQRALALLPKSQVSSRGIVAINLGLAYWHSGHMPEAERALAEALEAGQATGNHYIVLTALIFQGRVMAVRGQLRGAAEVFGQAIQQGGQMPINALAHLDLSALHYEWIDLNASEDHLHEAIDLSQRGRNDEFLVACWMMETRLRLTQGDADSASRALEKAQELVSSGGIPEGTAVRVSAIQVQFALAQGDLAGALRWEDRLTENVDFHSFCRFLGLTRARLLLAQNRKADAAAYLARLYEMASQGGWQYGLIAARALQSLTAKNSDEALAFLTEALQLAQPEGYIRVFADLGVALIPLLQEAALQGVSPDYVGQILAAIGEPHKPVIPADAPLVEPLSAREIEVLRLVTAGLSNREIAGKLVISPGTAKTHVHNICGKLGVRNRTAAATRAKELGLV